MRESCATHARFLLAEISNRPGDLAVGFSSQTSRPSAAHNFIRSRMSNTTLVKLPITKQERN
eukprot:3355826-Karenia_brevis.AAC.1